MTGRRSCTSILRVATSCARTCAAAPSSTSDFIPQRQATCACSARFRSMAGTSWRHLAPVSWSESACDLQAQPSRFLQRPLHDPVLVQLHRHDLAILVAFELQCCRHHIILEAVLALLKYRKEGLACELRLQRLPA